MNWHSYRQHNSRFLFFAFAVLFLSSLSIAQNNPIPQIVGPVHPDAVAPGSGAFTLSVYGANFVPGSVVNWNYQPRVTTYISGHEIQAQILARDVEQNTAGYITVTNPAPGGGSSSASWAQVEVHDPISAITVDPWVYYEFGDWMLLPADFTHDGILDLVGQADGLDFYRGNGDGTFTYASIVDKQYLAPYGAAYGDFNNDGNLDVVDASDLGNTTGFDPTRMDVMLGNGDGTFRAGTPIWRKIGNLGYVVAGDFNQDGNLDLITSGDHWLTPYLGQGDGSFALGTLYHYPSFGFGNEMLVGDFNNDGKLDLIFYGGHQTSEGFTKVVWFVAGNGDGTFQTPQAVGVFPNTNTCVGGGYGEAYVQLSDFNGDGNLDLAFCNRSQIGVMLGNGDGTFKPPTFYTADSTGQGQFTFAVGDINSDGKPDLIVSEYPQDVGSTFVVMLGNGDGTFQTPQVVASGLDVPLAEIGIAVGDFNSSGLPGAIFYNDLGMYVYLQQ
jgi:hypothetical protein